MLMSSEWFQLLKHYFTLLNIVCEILCFTNLCLIHREPGSGFTPLMEASASGHEIIVQYFLDQVSVVECLLFSSARFVLSLGFMLYQKVRADERNAKGETARALAMMYGYTKIVGLIDSRAPRLKPGTGLLSLMSLFGTSPKS